MCDLVGFTVTLFSEYGSGLGLGPEITNLLLSFKIIISLSNHVYRSVSGFLVQWQLLRRLLGLVMHSHIHEHITDSWHIASVRDRAAADSDGAIEKIIDDKCLHPVLSLPV